MFSPQQSRDRQVFRSAGSVVLWWAWLVLAVASLAAIVADGHGHSSAVAAVSLLALTGLAYGCALRPRIVADEHGISVLNPLREHAVPWAAVTKVDLVNALRVHCAPAPGASRGPVIHSWAVQSSARPKLSARRTAQRTARQPAGYGSLPPEAQDALSRSTAEFIAKQLDERAARERESAVSAPTAGGPSGSPSASAGTSAKPSEGQSPGPSEGPSPGPSEPGPSPGPSEGQSAGTSVSAPVAGPVQVTWAWAPIAAMTLPLLALIIVVLA